MVILFVLPGGGEVGYSEKSGCWQLCNKLKLNYWYKENENNFSSRFGFIGNKRLHGTCRKEGRRGALGGVVGFSGRYVAGRICDR